LRNCARDNFNVIQDYTDYQSRVKTVVKSTVWVKTHQDAKPSIHARSFTS
jgi:hypothetical protein